MFVKHCEVCVTDKSKCDNCRDNPKYANVPKHSLFQDYIPLCPRGYVDCISDPAYIKRYHPSWYKEIYGDMTPEEALFDKGGCMDRFKNDPDMEYYCYDDEDK